MDMQYGQHDGRRTCKVMEDKSKVWAEIFVCAAEASGRVWPAVLADMILFKLRLSSILDIRLVLTSYGRVLFQGLGVIDILRSSLPEMDDRWGEIRQEVRTAVVGRAAEREVGRSL